MKNSMVLKLVLLLLNVIQVNRSMIINDRGEEVEDDLADVEVFSLISVYSKFTAFKISQNSGARIFVRYCLTKNLHIST